MNKRFFKTNTILSSSRFFATVTVALLSGLFAQADVEMQPEEGRGDGVMWIVSPLAGNNHSKMNQRGRDGQTAGVTENALEYGLFALAVHPRFAVNDFLFFTEAGNDTDVIGNFFHANFYGAPEETATWNLGLGHLYHKIEPSAMDIRVNVMMAKIGPMLRHKPSGLEFNPYLGLARERVSTRFGSQNDDSLLCGLSTDWRWRMVNINLKYYYQKSHRQRNSFNNFHLRFTTGITRNCGLALRIDHIEQSAVKNTSVLAGPVFIF